MHWYRVVNNKRRKTKKIKFKIRTGQKREETIGCQRSGLKLMIGKQRKKGERIGIQDIQWEMNRKIIENKKRKEKTGIQGIALEINKLLKLLKDKMLKLKKREKTGIQDIGFQTNSKLKSKMSLRRKEEKIGIQGIRFQINNRLKKKNSPRKKEEKIGTKATELLYKIQEKKEKINRKNLHWLMRFPKIKMSDNKEIYNIKKLLLKNTKKIKENQSSMLLNLLPKEDL